MDKNADSTAASPAAVYTSHPDVPSHPSWDEHFPIIVHSHLRWDFVWQRPQQIFSRLADNHRIAYVEEPLAAAASDTDAPRLEITEPLPNLVRIVPVLPAALVDIDDQSAAVLGLMRVALQEHPLLRSRFIDPVQWFYSPMTAPGLLGQFGARHFVYDCMDELANFRFAPADIVERERFLLSHADVVFTGGYQLFESKSRHHDNVHFYGCGVDVAHFGRARLTQTPVAPSVSTLTHPVFGYFGVIDERLDYSLIEGLAQAFPEASIVMAGPVVKVDAGQLPRLPNIHWLGQQAYELLPDLVKGFDVCLMPFALNDATRYINPTKTLEYMAAGKPIVSTAVADVVRNFTPVVHVARSREDFFDAVNRARLAPDAALIAEGVRRASQSSWTGTVASMRRIVLSAVQVSADAAAVS